MSFGKFQIGSFLQFKKKKLEEHQFPFNEEYIIHFDYYELLFILSGEVVGVEHYIVIYLEGGGLKVSPPSFWARTPYIDYPTLKRWVQERFSFEIPYYISVRILDCLRRHYPEARGALQDLIMTLFKRGEREAIDFILRRGNHNCLKNTGNHSKFRRGMDLLVPHYEDCAYCGVKVAWHDQVPYFQHEYAREGFQCWCCKQWVCEKCGSSYSKICNQCYKEAGTYKFKEYAEKYRLRCNLCGYEPTVEETVKLSFTCPHCKKTYKQLDLKDF